jgi:hypothetical protein
MIKKAVQLATAFLLSDGVFKTASSVSNATHVHSYLYGGMKAGDMRRCLFGLKIGLSENKRWIE